MKKQPRKQGLSDFVPLILIGVGVVLILGVLVWQFLPRSIGTVVPASTTAPISVENSYPEIQRVSLVNAKTAFDNKEAVFVDVRDSGSYQAGHIPGALNIPLTEIEAGTADLSQIKKDQWIITYCT